MSLSMPIKQHYGDAVFCQVCATEIPADQALSQVYGDKILYFCGQDHLKAYLLDPEKYTDTEEEEVE